MIDKSTKIEYLADGTPIVNGQIPKWRIKSKTPIYDRSGHIADYDCELEPTNEAARIIAMMQSATDAPLTS